MNTAENVLVLTQWGFKEGLIQSYTLPYLKIINEINPDITFFLVTQEKKLIETSPTLKSQELKGCKIRLYPEKYFRIGVAKFLLSGYYLLKYICLILFYRIRIIHTFCTPAGALGYILSKVTGCCLIVDSYEPHSEYMKDNGVWSSTSLTYKLLSKLEKQQACHAKYLIATTPAVIDFIEKRFSIEIENFFIKPACVNLENFVYKEVKAQEKIISLRIENKLIGIYAGKFGGFYLNEEIFEFLCCAFELWGSKLHIILLSDLSGVELDHFCYKFNLNTLDFTLKNVPHDEMPVYLSMADFAISPYRPTPSKKYCTPIKNGEYWAIGLPVIITKDISVDSEIISNADIGYVLQNLNKSEYKIAINKINELLNGDRDALRAKIRQIAVEHRSYQIAKNVYQTIYS